MLPVKCWPFHVKNTCKGDAHLLSVINYLRYLFIHFIIPPWFVRMNKSTTMTAKPPLNDPQKIQCTPPLGPFS